jgi:hypothetical protein
MTKKNRYKARRAAMHASMMETLRQWVNAHQRGREPFKDLRRLFTTAFGADNLLSREALIDRHRIDNGVSLNIAMAEVDQFQKDIIEDLRRNGLGLVHPVTEFGFTNAATVDVTDERAVARCVPGLGSGGALYGWRVAHLAADPLWVAYIEHRYRSGKAAVAHSVNIAMTGVAAGVLTAGNVGTPLMPDKLIE